MRQETSVWGLLLALAAPRRAEAILSVLLITAGLPDSMGRIQAVCPLCP